jgi:RNA polymerase sigma-70 factor (ECF subfamily)
MAEPAEGRGGPNPRYATRLSLLERVKARDQQAWEDLVYIYSPLVRHLCARWQVRDADADDVVQEVFGAVAASISRYQRQAEGATFRAWLGGIIRNKLLDFYRARERQPQAAGGADAYEQLQKVAAGETADEEPEPEQLQGVAQRALTLIRCEFEDRTWRAFWRTTVDGQQAAAIAAELGMSAGAVRQAKARVLRRLKEQLGDVID